MKLWTLTENTACRGDLLAEHGLSLYIETGSHKLLFDAGQTDAFAANAAKLGVDLGQVDAAVLSHGHYDHGGGMLRFLELNQKAKIYVNQNAFLPHYNGENRYIGLAPELKESRRLVLVGETLELGDGLSLHACNARECKFPAEFFGLQVMEAGILQADDFCHEQYLLVQEQGRRILFSGCSHKGILNIVSWFQPDVLVGGFHFSKIPPESPRLQQAAEQLLQYPTVYYTGHCTGQAQFQRMRQIMGDRLQRISTGTVLTL